MGQSWDRAVLVWAYCFDHRSTYSTIILHKMKVMWVLLACLGVATASSDSLLFNNRFRRSFNGTGAKGAVGSTAPPGKRITCYRCTGFDSNRKETPGSNTEYCSSGYFNAKEITAETIEVPPAKSTTNSVACLILTLKDKDWNDGYAFVQRMPFSYLEQDYQQDVDDLRDMFKRIAPDHKDSMNVITTVCHDNLCNGSPTLRSGLLLGAVLLCLSLFH